MAETEIHKSFLPIKHPKNQLLKTSKLSIMKNYKANLEDFQNEKLVATELKVVRGGDGVPPVDPGKNNGGNGNT